jgi:membrane-bound lytic murein transglycosylase F
MIYRSLCFVFALLFVHFGAVSTSSAPGFRTAFSRMSNPRGGHILPWESQALAGNWEISRYDVLLREVADREGHDWRLLSAIAYKESRFDPQAVSRRGAVGLMQIMPAVARGYDVNEEMMRDPRTNVTMAAKLLTSIGRSLRFSASATPRDRMSIALASYNCGIGHVLDARRLAVEHGADPDSWEDVSIFLCMKSDPAYACHEVVECGIFNGSDETIAFVDGVMGRYRSYCDRVKL